jgi:glyoxylase-like metal-dependent hydrolase (beta-lactamase superfamily II)
MAAGPFATRINMRQPNFEVYALKYATHLRPARDNFIGADPHETSPMPLDYFIWVVKSNGRIIVVDTGFGESGARKRGRQLLRSPAEGLDAIGIRPREVEDVIITHMHYDHSGNHDLFPQARYHVQDREMAFCTGRFMTHSLLQLPFEVEDVNAMLRKLYAGRVEFHDGDEEIAPGVSVHRVGGHSGGLQMVRVNTRRGMLVLASDAAHFYANLGRGLPFPYVFNVGDVLEGFGQARRLADSPDHIIPGHDPLVLERHPAAKPELKGWVARLD